jgi:hypothetical protein
MTQLMQNAHLCGQPRRLIMSLQSKLTWQLGLGQPKINNAPNQARELVVDLGFAEVAVRPKFIALLNAGLLV